MAGRKKNLSAEDLEVWRLVTNRVHRTLPVSKIQVPIEPAPPKGIAPTGIQIRPFKIGDKAVEKKVKQPPAFAAKPAKTSSNMDKKNFQKLLKGKMEIDATVDLHGMTADQAKAYLQTYLVRSHKMGYRMILVITGKGKPKGLDEFNRPKGGVLRQSLRDWLSGPLLASKVLQVSQAQPKHGGSGAFYVYLRRRREA